MKSLLHFFRLKLRSKLGFSLVEVMIVAGVMSIIGLGMASIFSNSNKSQKRIEQKQQQVAIENQIRGVLSSSAMCLLAFCQVGSTCSGANVFGSEAGDLPGTTNPGINNVFNFPGPLPTLNLTGVQQATVVGTAGQRVISCVGSGDGCNSATYTVNQSIPTVAPFGTPIPSMGDFYLYGLRLTNMVYVGQLAGIHYTTGNLILQYAQDPQRSSGGKLRDSNIPITFQASGAGIMQGCIAGVSASEIWRVSPTDPTEIFYNTGNVGIGLTDPTAALDVAGNILATTVPGGSIAIRGNAGNPNDPGDLLFLNNDNSIDRKSVV